MKKTILVILTLVLLLLLASCSQSESESSSSKISITSDNFNEYFIAKINSECTREPTYCSYGYYNVSVSVDSKKTASFDTVEIYGELHAQDAPDSYEENYYPKKVKILVDGTGHGESETIEADIHFFDYKSFKGVFSFKCTSASGEITLK